MPSAPEPQARAPHRGSPSPVSFAQTLKRLRQEKRISQQELADLIGVHVRQVSKYEMGTSLPTLERIKRLAEVLTVSADEIVFGVAKRRTIPEAGAIRHPVLAEKLRKLETVASRDDVRSIVDLLDAFIAKGQIAHRRTSAS